LACHVFCLSASSLHLSLHSFPTRRSSDLLLRRIAEGCVDSALAAGLPEKRVRRWLNGALAAIGARARLLAGRAAGGFVRRGHGEDRKSTRLNSSHRTISYAVFCLKKKKRV